MQPEQDQTRQAVHAGQLHVVKQVEQTTCCIVGGGPGGVMLALLLARQGVAVTLLEAHIDFDREFRGDTLHPASMEILDEIGLADRLLQLRHSKIRNFGFETQKEAFKFNLFAKVKTKFPYITVIAQARFLEFIIEEAKRYPNFHLILGAMVDELIEENGIVRGIRYRSQDGWGEVRADLNVGADGRFSKLRKLAGFEPIKTSPPMDVLWFRFSRRETDPIASLDLRFGAGQFVIFIDRFDYWQMGIVIAKGGYQAIRAAGLDHLRQTFAQTVPEFADRVDELQDWKQIAVLSVESSRLKRWYKPGLLLIGDAAHVMSPVGGVGINYAIGDAVVAANRLGAKLKTGAPIEERDLAAVQRQREWPVRVIQAVQSSLQKRVVTRALTAKNGAKVFTPPAFVQSLLKVPWFLVLPARLIGFGLWPPHVKLSD